MTVVLLLISLLYACLTALLWWGWSRIKTGQSSVPAEGPLISVVIPVRNEAANLPKLLADLARQSYSHFEVIVADDSSTDNTVALVRQLANALPYTLHLLSLPDERTGAPKKRAIARSIGVASGALILTTDGDCRVGPDWILSFASYYVRHQPKMMTGPVTFTASGADNPLAMPSHTDGRAEPVTSFSVFAQLQTVEFASLIGAGAATLALGRPTMCNGANLCYEKRVFEEVNGFSGIDHIASGDDELLMHKIARQYPGQVRFLKNPAAVVRTAPHLSLRSFYYQRKRWASKWRAYDSWQPSALAVFVFLSNIAPLVGVWLAMAGVLTVPAILTVIALKAGPEFLFLRAVLNFLNQKRAVRWIPLTQLVYPFYVSFFGLAAQKKGFVWKGRQLN